MKCATWDGGKASVGSSELSGTGLGTDLSGELNSSVDLDSCTVQPAEAFTPSDKHTVNQNVRSAMRAMVQGLPVTKWYHVVLDLEK